MNTYDEAAKLWPTIAKYKKLVVSLTGTTIPLVIFLAEGPKPAGAVVGAVLGWLATNVGVERATNAG